MNPDQHASGRLLRWGSPNPSQAITASEGALVAQTIGGNDEANARRIIACWNACMGVSTENLEENLPVKELADRYNATLQQRDELLEAMQDMHQVLHEAMSTGGWVPTAVQSSFRHAWIGMMAAIAKATGTAAREGAQG